MASSEHWQRSALYRHIRRAIHMRTGSLLALGLLAQGTPALAADTNWNCHAVNGEWQCDSAAGSDTTDFSADGESAAQVKASSLDWVDADNMTAEQRKTLPPGCCGAYIAPVRTDEFAHIDPDKAAVHASADNSELQQETTAVLEGDVILTQGSRQLKADKATLDQSVNQAVIEGNIRIREPDILVTGTRADVSVESNQVSIDNAEFVLHNQRIRGKASKLERLSDEVIVLSEASYTTCEPGNHLWLLKGEEIALDPNKEQGTAKNVTLDIHNVPVFYWPYLSFPTGDTRKSGFLYPSIGSSDGGGIDLAIPYYLNLASNYDATVTPRFISDRGAMLELETRHLSQHFATTVSGSFLPDDDGGSDKYQQDRLDSGLISEDQLYPYQGQDRWLGHIDQRGRGDSWSSSINATRVSDKDYLRDLDSMTIENNSQTHLAQTGHVAYYTDHWTAKLSATNYQLIAANLQQPYRQLPRLNLDGEYGSHWWNLDLNNEVVRFDHRDEYDAQGRAIVTGDRFRGDYRLTLAQNWAWGYIKPGIGYQALQYQLDTTHLNADDNSNPQLGAAQAQLDMGVFFEREGNLFGSNYLQTFEPRLFYFYSEYDDHSDLYGLTDDNRRVSFDTAELTFSYDQLFRTTRFSGGDRIDDADQAAVGLTTRFIDANSGIERLRLSLGQVHYFDDRQVTLNGVTDTRRDSDYAFHASGQLTQAWNVNSDLLYNDEDGQLTRGQFGLRYLDNDYRIFNISYLYTRKNPIIDSNDFDNDGDTNDLLDTDIEQADVSFVWPVSDSWNVIGRANYDITNDRELEWFAGFEYDSCCYRTRFLARRWLDNDLQGIVDGRQLEYDQGLFVEFQLIGLGGIGDRISTILSDSIFGYSQREKALR